MMQTRYRAVLAGILFAIASGPLAGQVRQIQGGHVLDRNTRAGSGGRNYAVPNNYSGAYPGATNTQLGGITRTRGLSAFSGNAPSLDNQLGAGASTDGVDRFRRQSVGLSDVQSGRNLYTPQAQVYDDPLRTTLNPSQIVQREARQRVPLPGNTYRGDQSNEVNAMAKDLFVDAMADYKPLLPSETRQQLTGESLNVTPVDSRVENVEMAERLESAQAAQQGGEELFGMLRQADRDELARQISDFDLGQLTEESLALGSEQRNEPIQPLETRVTGEETLADRLTSPEDEEAQAEEELAARMPMGKTRALGGKQEIPQPDEDVFLDLLIDLRQKQLARQGQDTAEARTDEDKLTRTAAMMRQMQQNQVRPEDQQNIELTEDNQIIIHKLAGTLKDPFNRYMQSARKAMDGGHYYQAAREYNLAATVRPDNPLPLLGVSLATFAAEEWFTSGLNLQRAMELFPPLMETKLDLRQLLPQEDIQKRLGSLESWIEEVVDRPALLLLATFMNHNLGKDEQATAYAKKLKNLQKEIPLVMTAYADYILTGKPPVTTTRPAGTNITLPAAR